MELTESVLLLTVSTVLKKNLHRIEVSRWHASRILIELTSSLLLLTVHTIFPELPRTSAELNGGRCI
jgi:hypothetical protein